MNCEGDVGDGQLPPLQPREVRRETFRQQPQRVRIKSVQQRCRYR